MDKDAGKGGRVLKVLAAVAVAFGLMTLKEGGAVLFVDGAGRQAAGRLEGWATAARRGRLPGCRRLPLRSSPPGRARLLRLPGARPT